VEQVPEALVVPPVPHPAGVLAGVGLGRQAPEAVGVERPDRVADRLGGTPDHPADVGGGHPAGTGQEDLGPADGERVGRLPAGFQGLPLRSREGADERAWPVHPARVRPYPDSQTVSNEPPLVIYRTSSFG
jgi:hypothetical protein